VLFLHRAEEERGKIRLNNNSIRVAMRFIIWLALIFGFCLLLLVGLLNVLRDLFARNVHSQPSIPGAESGRRRCDDRQRDDGLSHGQSLSGV
jgi:hypothetical protein